MFCRRTCESISTRYCTYHQLLVRLAVVLFAKNQDFSKIFEIFLHKSPPKSTCYWFILRNFDTNYQKVLKKFLRRLRRRKKHVFGAFGAENVQKYLHFFNPDLQMGTPPFWGDPPPKNLPDTYYFPTVLFTNLILFTKQFFG